MSATIDGDAATPQTFTCRLARSPREVGDYFALRPTRGGMIAPNVQPTLEPQRDRGASTSVAEQW